MRAKVSATCYGDSGWLKNYVFNLSSNIYDMATHTNLAQERNKLVKKIDQLLEGPMIFLGFVWLILIVIDLSKGLTRTLTFISSIIWFIFIVDFLLKFILAPKKVHFLKRNWLGAISLIVPALRLFRIFRFLRILRSVRGLNLIKIISSINRSMHSLNATMARRGFHYVLILTVVIVFAGAAGMYAFENKAPGGLTSYSNALWWTFMLIITIGSEYWPQTPEGRVLCFLLALYGFTMFGYITATIASFFVDRDAEEKDAPIASSEDVAELRKEIQLLTKAVNELTIKSKMEGSN
jgi:voltage-gated potassium channel